MKLLKVKLFLWLQESYSKAVEEAAAGRNSRLKAHWSSNNKSMSLGMGTIKNPSSFATKTGGGGGGGGHNKTFFFFF